MAGSIRAGKIFVELMGRDVGLTRSLSRLQRRLHAMSAGFSAFSDRVLGTGIQAASALTAIGVPVGFATAKFMSFDAAMRTVQAVSTEAGVSFDQLREQAKELGATTSFTATQVAEAMVSLGRAGFSTDEITQAIGGVLSLSKATGTELPLAAQIASDLMRGFGISTAETARVVDVLAATANGSSQTLEDLFESLKLVGRVASDAGASLEETAAATAILANNGIKGSLAGTAIRRAYLNLADSAKRASLEKVIGKPAVDAAGNLRPLSTLLVELNEAMVGKGNAERLAAFVDLLGARAVTAGSAIASSNAQFQDMLTTLENSSGAAGKAQKLMESGLTGAFYRLASAAEGVQIAIGEALAGALGTLFDHLSSGLTFVRLFINQNQEAAVTMLRWFGIVSVGVAGVIAAGVALKVLAVGFTLITSVVSGVITLFTTLTSVVAVLVSPLGLAAVTIVGLVAAFTDWRAVIDMLSTAIPRLVNQFLEFAGVRATLQDIGQRAGEVLRSITAAFQRGDMELAAQIAFKGIELALRTTLDGMLTKWSAHFGQVQSLWDKMTTGLAKQLLRIGTSRIARASAALIPGNVAGSVLAGNELSREFQVDVDVDAMEKILDDDLARRESQRKADAEAAAKSRVAEIGRLRQELAALQSRALSPESDNAFGLGFSSDAISMAAAIGQALTEDAKSVAARAEAAASDVRMANELPQALEAGTLAAAQAFQKAQGEFDLEKEQLKALEQIHAAAGEISRWLEKAWAMI